MMQRLHYIFCLLLSGCFFHSAFSQTVSVNIAADKNQILIGEPIHVQLEASVPEGTNAGWFALDSIPHFDIVAKEKIDTVVAEQGNTYRQTITVTSFDSGSWAIPPMALNVGDRSYLTDSVVVSVAYSNFDPSQPYHDIKNILDAENPVVQYINWAIAAVTLLSLLGFVYFLRKRIPKMVQPGIKKTALLSPLEEALMALEQVKKQQLVQQGKLKVYYTSLNDILRDFVSKKMLVSTTEKTNEQLILQLNSWDMPYEALISLAQTLRLSDVVKFAKFVPGEQDNEQSFNTIRESVELMNNLK